MAHDLCPWWLGYLLITPLRRWVQDPRKLLPPLVRTGMTVLEPGPGMGFFTLELLRLVGPAGRIVAVDVQPQMLAGLARRARRAGLEKCLELRQPQGTSLAVDDLAGQVDLALVVAVVHELPDAALFFRETCAALKPGGALLLSEPPGHVNQAAWQQTLDNATAAGLQVGEAPVGWKAHAARLIKPK